VRAALATFSKERSDGSQTRSVSDELCFMLTLVRARIVNNQDGIYWNRDIRMGEAFVARARVAQAPPTVAFANQ
jgi:hypothetical protein